MILIKNRHPVSVTNLTFIPGNGKYDTYKGSTQAEDSTATVAIPGGKYDTYKGSTLKVELVIIDFRLFGKYDTYKGFIDIEY